MRGRGPNVDVWAKKYFWSGGARRLTERKGHFISIHILSVLQRADIRCKCSFHFGGA